jgi:biopolymer transport protein ExbB/TolQ
MTVMMMMMMMIIIIIIIVCNKIINLLVFGRVYVCVCERERESKATKNQILQAVVSQDFLLKLSVSVPGYYTVLINT